MKYQFAVWHQDCGTYGFMDYNIAKSLYDNLCGQKKMFALNSSGNMEILFKNNCESEF